MKPIDRRIAGMWRWPLAAALLMTFLLYVPTPYLVVEPGLTESAVPLVKLAAADQQGQGGFYLTTIYMSPKSNYLSVLRAYADKDKELYSKKTLLKGNSLAEYSFRSKVMMEESQSSAVEAAYREAGIAYTIKPRAVAVSDAGKAKQAGFRAGDRLQKIDGEPFKGIAEMVGLLKERQGKNVDITVLRSGKLREINVKPVHADNGVFTEKDLARLLGYGIELTEIRSIEPKEASRKISIEAGDVGGPSAGLMFALQAYDLLTKGDLSKGYQIAGTGTIDPAGKVGAIGGAGLKIVTADRAGADYFLSPAQNYDETKKKAESIGTRMKVIPVSSIQQAVRALESLPAR